MIGLLTHKPIILNYGNIHLIESLRPNWSIKPGLQMISNETLGWLHIFKNFCSTGVCTQILMPTGQAFYH